LIGVVEGVSGTNGNNWGMINSKLGLSSGVLPEKYFPVDIL
jgi:hypothetical protein